LLESEEFQIFIKNYYGDHYLEGMSVFADYLIGKN